MSWVAVGAAVMWGADKVIGGFGAASAGEIQAQRDAVEQIYQDKLNLAGKDLDILGETQALTKAKASQDYLVGTAASGSQASDVVGKITAGTDAATKKSGFATSTEISSKEKVATSDVLDKYKQSIVDLTKSKEQVFEGADLAFARGEQGVKRSKLQADQERQALLTDIEAQPEGFWEGMWS